MSVVSVRPKDFILALFIRDDGERFLLGDNGYDFKDSQLHFVANTIENDEVVKQGADGVMLAGQVRRSAVQSFDGFVGDATTPKETIEQMRRAFFAFFVRGHHFRVIYIDTARDAWQRKGGYLVDAPEIKELYQIHPEYHVGLNFEDVNYYSYDEDADGNEILANLLDIPVSTAVAGGLVWDEDGAVSEDAVVDYDSESAGAQGKSVYINDAAEAPLSAFKLDGETSQNGTPTPSAPVAVQTVTGENVVKITGKNLFDKSNPNLLLSNVYIGSNSLETSNGAYTAFIECLPNTTYTISKTAGARFICGTTTTLPATGVAIANRTADNTASSITLTTSSTAKYLVAFYFLSSADSGTQQAMLDSLQFELGSPASSFEPYQGQSYEVNLGKNLFDKDTATLGYRIGSDGLPYTDGNYFLSDYIQVSPNSKYEISPAGTTTDYGSSATAYYDSSKAFISRVLGANSGWQHISTPANCAYIRFTTNKIVIDSTQLEKGSQVTSYAAYFAPIELCKIGDYQDYIYKSGSKWYAHKAVGKGIYDGSEDENWTWSSGSRIDITISDAFLGSASNNPVLSNRYKATWAVANGNIFLSGIWHGAGIVDTTNAPNLSSWKTYLASNNVIIYYALATPTDTEITNEALISQLNALLTTAKTYVGINNIFTITPNEQGTLEVGYYTKYQPIVTGGGYVWEAGGSGGPTTVMNNSIDNVSPIWTIYGPTQNPQLENTTTGETIEYVGVIADGQTLVVDMGEQTASLDGLNVISNLVGDFIQLAPGANRLIYTVTGDAGASQIGWSEIVG